MEKLARQKVGHADAPDVVHDVFIAVWSKAKETVKLTPAYLAGATRFTAISHFRSEKRRATFLDAITEEQYCPPVNLPDQIVSARQELRLLQEALSALPKRTRQVFLLRRLHQCSYPEIAAAMCISVSTVEREMARALLTCKTIEANPENSSRKAVDDDNGV